MNLIQKIQSPAHMFDIRTHLYHPFRDYVLSEMGAPCGSLLYELDHNGTRAANKLLRRLTQYRCPEDQTDKKGWVVELIIARWESRCLARNTKGPEALASARRI